MSREGQEWVLTCTEWAANLWTSCVPNVHCRLILGNAGFTCPMDMMVVRSSFKKIPKLGQQEPGETGGRGGDSHQSSLAFPRDCSLFYCRLPLPSYFSYFSLCNKPPYNLVAFNNNDFLFLTILWFRTSGRVGWAVLVLRLAMVGGSLIQPDSSVLCWKLPNGFIQMFLMRPHHIALLGFLTVEAGFQEESR